MYIKSLELENFRNYKKEITDFNKGVNLIIGENAQGKTNLIEAIYVSSIGKSFRTVKDRELINFNSQFSNIKTEYIKYDELNKVEVKISDDGKKYVKVNDVNIKKRGELIENILTVIFSPEDLKIVKEDPSKRRSFIDRELCQLKISYYDNLINYKKTLQNRNHILKNNKIDKNYLIVLDMNLAKYGAKIIKERALFVEKINEISNKIHSNITNGKENLEVKYISDIPYEIELDKIEENFYNTLEKNREIDMYKRTTSRGIQKDDLKIIINNIDARKFASQGQQRTAALSLKLSEIDLIKNEKKESPILILDDVMSELDKDRQMYMITSLKDIQIFITTTELSDDILKEISQIKVIKVKKGNLTSLR